MRRASTVTPDDLAMDSLSSYELAIQCERLRLLTRGDTLPVEGDEKRLDIVIMAALHDPR